MLNLVIAEAALELVPKQISRHVSVTNDAKRRGAEPQDTLLDRSIHHRAMLNLPEDYKRGRPDLVHLTLLNATSTPLYQSGGIKVYIHTRTDVVLDIKEKTRPPKSYDRFRDLVQKLLREEPESGLISVHRASIPQLLEKLSPDFVMGFSIQGKTSNLEDVAADVLKKRNPVMLIGGFPKGHFMPETVASLDVMARIHESPLDAHVVVARLLYELEKAGSG